MSAFNQLPPIYKIAIFLGARVEVAHNNKWYNINQMMGLTSKTPYRIVEKDLHLFEKAREIALQAHTIVKYHDYDYMLPNNALTPGSIVIMRYGFGVYVQVQEDLTLMELEKEVAEKILEDTQQQYYYCISYEEFFS